jgi:hypothetical protein
MHLDLDPKQAHTLLKAVRGRSDEVLSEIACVHPEGSSEIFCSVDG